MTGYTSPIPPNAAGHDFPPAASCHNLVESLKAREEPPPSVPQAKTRKKQKKKNKAQSEALQVSRKAPLMILVIDEAHGLTRRAQKDGNWSNFSVLALLLHTLSRLPLFTLFLSTTGKMSQFISPFEDPLNRAVVGLNLVEPFTDLGFDILAKKVSLDGRWTLEHVILDAHIVHLGHPL